MDEVVIALMIEKRGAIEELDAILGVEGVDLVQFGPADYSITVGKPGQRDGEVGEAERHMIGRALERGVHPRVEIATFEQAEPYLEMGVRHFCLGWDLVALAAWSRQQSKGMRELLEKAF